MGNTAVAILAVGALILGAFMAYSAADFMQSQYTDPHDFTNTYAVSGTEHSEPVTGIAECSPIHENGSFYNYSYSILLSNGQELEFILIFEPSETPFDYDLISEGDGIREYVSKDGIISISVGEYCRVSSFSYDDGVYSLIAGVDVV